MKKLLENWKKFLEEDEQARANFAKGLEKVSPDIRDQASIDFGTMARAGRAIKQLYAKEADRAFLDSLKTVHSTSSSVITGTTFSAILFILR